MSALIYLNSMMTQFFQVLKQNEADIDGERSFMMTQFLQVLKHNCIKFPMTKSFMMMSWK